MTKQPPHRPTQIRAWRRKSGLSLDQLADKANVDKGNLSKMERGILPYNQEVLERLARVLGRDAGDLIDREPEQANSYAYFYRRGTPAQRAQLDRIAKALVGGEE